MAAAGLCAVLGGAPEQVENAAEIGMEHHLGLTCDPVGGLVQIPCIERNAIARSRRSTPHGWRCAATARHIVSLDQVIRTMRETGADMMTQVQGDLSRRPRRQHRRVLTAPGGGARENRGLPGSPRARQNPAAESRDRFRRRRRREGRGAPGL
jgi:hypothetical protein